MFKDTDQQLNSIEINDLISDAIVNAAERRRQALELADLSTEESENVMGGLSLAIIRPFPIGLIYTKPELF